MKDMSKSYTIEDYNNEFNKRNVNIVAIEEHTENGKRFIKCRCQECNNTFLRERGVMSGYRGCPVCRGLMVVRGVNDIATTNPSSIPYFVNEEDAYTHTSHSNAKVDFKCTKCGKIQKLAISGVLNHRNESYLCHNCSPKEQHHNQLSISDINERLKKRQITVIRKRIENGVEYLDCSCGRCGGTFSKPREKVMTNIKKKACPICAGFQTVKGINDIATTDPWAVPYFVNKDDVYRHSRSSKETAIIKCCRCGKENKLMICNFFYNRNEDKNKGCKYCSQKYRSYTFEELKNLYAQKHPELTITNYNEDAELYTLHCNNCGGNFTRTYSTMKVFRGCNICTSKMIVKGVNDIATTAPWIVPYVVDKEYCYTHTATTKDKTLMKCTTCGYERMASVQQFSKREHYYCPMCDDGISYPNKYGREFLKQLPIDNLQAEYYDDWTNGKIFDNYFEYDGVPYVVEMDGAIHYRDGKYTTLEKCRANDRYKDQLCKDKGIELIRIDCKQSRPAYIKNSILNSRFTELFDLSKIDWDKCDCCASESAIKVVCDCYNEHPTMTQYEIADCLDIPYSRVGKYLRKGAKLGLCDYSSEKAIENKSCKTSEMLGYHVVAYDLKMNKIGEYPSIVKAIKALKEIYPDKPIYQSGVTRVLNGEKDNLNGIIFQRVN